MTSSTGTVVFNDAKLQAIDVVATERLGVGTLDPASNLHVVGNVHVTGNVNKLNFTDGYTIKRGANVTVFGTTDVIQEITGPHARGPVPLRKYPEVAMTAAITSGYTTEASSQLNSAFPSWNAFNGVVETVNNGGGEWISGTDTYDTSATNGAYLAHSSNSVLFEGQRGEYLGIILPSAIKLDYINVYGRFDTTDSRTVREYILWGSNDGSSWTQLQTGTNTLAAVSSTNLFVVPVRATNFYSRFRLQALSMNTNAGEVSIGEMQLYGYEETSDPDTSVDTKITSQFNLPDTTGVKLYIDGDKGSTATDFSGEGHTLTENNATYDSAEKAWEFSSLSTSNVTMTSGDLAMEGTHPHSVSLWFNAANVSSNATLFHVGTAAGEGDAKTAISLTETGHLGWIDGGDNQFLSANTWHNLVYATQGGGGVRTCYLDGRKLGDAQVQDTFGDYPPFAMTTYSEYGYTVSASTEYSGYEAWEAFDDVTGDTANYWSAANALYNASSPFNFTSSGDPYETTVGGTLYTGDWIQIEMPHRIKLDYVTIFPRLTNRFPRQGVFAGSNDGENWDLIHAFSGLSVATETDTAIVTNSENNTKAYKYIRLVITHLNGGTYAAADNIKFFGHKENDATRFPVSSTVLKYPHVAMTGPAQRGYVVTQSSYSTYNVNYGYGWKAFDSTRSSDSSGFSWQTDSSGSGTYPSSGDARTGVDVETITENSNTHVGSWVTLETPRKIQVSSVELTCPVSIDQYRPNSVVVLGSDNNSTWNFLKGDISSTYTNDIRTITINSTIAYKYHMLLVKTIGSVGAGYATTAFLSDIRYYGTEPEDVVARVGEGLDGKVANFRVYDKYLHEEQALELWDAQKDQFGRAKSSVVVHKGRLGVGTTEPEGRFAVLDEAHAPEEFPPRAMTDWQTYMEGHGVFRAFKPENITGYAPHRAFDKDPNVLWAHDGTPYDTNGNYVGGGGGLRPITFEAVNGTGTFPSGEWVGLELPYKIKLEHFILTSRNHTQHLQEFPRKFSVYATSDGLSWVLLKAFDNIDSPGQAAKTAPLIVHSNESYKSFVWIWEKIQGSAAVGGTQNQEITISNISLFGTREQGQSTLHDGQLTLTKNLTVPRIGPALDADDTPRRDRLVVEYNTSTNPTANGTVKDTSGRGNDINLYNGASYDATEKALVFDGTDDYAAGTQNLGTGTPTHTISGWFKRTSSLSNYTWVFTIGTSAEGQMSGLLIDPTGDIVFDIFNHRIETTHTITNGVWYHFAGVFNGGTTTWSVDTCDVYINGVLESTQTTGTAPKNFNLTGNQIYFGTSTNFLRYFTGKISNFKLYDTALTADEVKRLYDMGRCDEGHHVVNFSKTRVGIGLGDGEAPTYTLDVRGQIRSQGTLQTSFTGQHKCVPENGEPVEKGLIVSASKNKYVKLNGSLDTGKKAITIDESLPVVSLSNVAQDKACFGVVSSTEEANTVYRIETTNGGVISHIPKTLGDNRVIVNSVGEGAIWVCDANGPLESGDYITTSNVAGYGQKQTGEFLANYTVAKITMDCDFTGSNVAVQAIKKAETLKTVTEEVWEGLSDYDRSSNTETQYINESNVVLSVEEYESLAPEEQNTYSETTIQTYYQIQRGENVLDEHGMLQWENTGATEPGYELRYLDATGQQTDEANCVHRAAFVGCTYHCG
jgi:hypothetical protein